MNILLLAILVAGIAVILTHILGHGRRGRRWGRVGVRPHSLF